MSTHNGVSCDSCTVSNFPGRRYKCLLCDNYDLCGKCYDAEAESQNHKNNHPMQCILTEAAAELFYKGEKLLRRSVVSLTCSHCGQAGFIPRTLLVHCMEKHSSSSLQTTANPAVMCPICVTSPTHRSRSRFVSLGDHIAATHDEGTGVDGSGNGGGGGGGGGGGEDEFDLTFSPQTTQPRQRTNDEDDSDEDEDEEESPANDPENQSFVDEEQRRQQAAHQRLVTASSTAATARSEYLAALSAYTNSSATQRRGLSRQNATRVARGGGRGHFHSSPYGSTSRAAAGLTAGTTTRLPTDQTSTSTTQSTNLAHAWTAVFGQDPMLELVSELLNTDQPPTATVTNPSVGQFVIIPSMFENRPPTASSALFTFGRPSQQTENSEGGAQITRTSLLAAKQKRASQAQQQLALAAAAATNSQQPTPSNPFGRDYYSWQQQLPTQSPATNGWRSLVGGGSNDRNVANGSVMNPTTRMTQSSHGEGDPRSLLEKVLKNDQNVNKDEKSETPQCQEHNRLALIQSALLSSILNLENEEQKEKNPTVDKENHV